MYQFYKIHYEVAIPNLRKLAALTTTLLYVEDSQILHKMCVNTTLMHLPIYDGHRNEKKTTELTYDPKVRP